MLDEPYVLATERRCIVLVNLHEGEGFFFAVIVRLQIRTILLDELVILFQPRNEVLELNPRELTHLLPFLGQKARTLVRFPRAIVVYDNIHATTVVVGSTRILYESTTQQNFFSFWISMDWLSIDRRGGGIISAAE